MAFSKGIKKLFTTPIYLFGENTEKSEEKEEEELFVEDEKGEVKWYDKVFSWPISLGTWFIEMLYINPFEYPNELSKERKSKKLHTTTTPLIKFVTFFVIFTSLIVSFGILIIGVIGFTGWIITNF